MDGVTILSVIEPISASEIFATMLFVGAFGGLFIGLLFTVIEMDPQYLAVGVTTGLILGLFLGCIFGGAITDDKSPRYKVTISEEVNFQEFHNTYDIISQEGNIYTVKLK